MEELKTKNKDTTKPEEMKVLTWPTNTAELHERCHPVTFADGFKQNIGKIVIDMAYTMVQGNGIGLAAPQVGIPLNFFVLLIDNNPTTFINPEILESSSDMFEWEEGCLSIPGYFDKRARPKSVIVKFQTLMGDTREIELRGLWAFAFQHEYDHLDGKLFIDGYSWLRRMRVENKVKKHLSKKRKKLL